MTSYLILHKVRGQPAFDIAHRIEVLGEERWICSTSGIQCYPYCKWRLEDLCDCSDYPLPKPPWTCDGDLPTDWPEHDLYWATKTDGLYSSFKGELMVTLASLGLRQSRPMKKRKI